jgi:DNA mismatch repair protein MutS2
MLRITDKNKIDLGFDKIIAEIALLCNTYHGELLVQQLSTDFTQDSLLHALKTTHEFLGSFSSQNHLPNHGFESIDKDLQLLKIEDSILEKEAFMRFLHICQTTYEHVNFLNKFKDYYVELSQISEKIVIQKEIVLSIKAIFDKFGEIKNDATPQLAIIRKSSQLVKSKINQSFQSALAHFNPLGYLDEIKESVIENTRVLAVVAMHKKKVKGAVLGSSKTGSIVFIEPEATRQLTRQLQELIAEEKVEVEKILFTLSLRIRPFCDDLAIYQTYLATMDFISAKAKYARKIHAILPQINDEKRMVLRDAYHPILYLNNLREKSPTYPLQIEINQNQRIIVISGPNAGGKTIALKTIGLLQLMLQSGLLVPVHERSEMFFFDRLMSDIGDNQSIENHLSTYSYRLKNMNFFLKKCQANTLFLIDEFGTGSDPELGGALAEAFLEEFYHRGSFGVITTHYTNLKLLVNEMPAMINANMMFDQHTLEPTYKLIVGEAGSSFTFEVAQKNGIPFGLINKAKKKIEKGKVRFDKSLVSLQKERIKLEKTNVILKQEEVKALAETEKVVITQQKLQEKLVKYQTFYDTNQRLVYLGEKINQLADQYFESKNKKVLMGELIKLVEIENSKKNKKTSAEKIIEKKKVQEIKQEILPEIEVIREKKKKEKMAKKKAEEALPKRLLKVGDRVRMFDGKAIGSIDKIDKNVAFVNYGIFTSKVSLELLEFVG